MFFDDLIPTILYSSNKLMLMYLFHQAEQEKIQANLKAKEEEIKRALNRERSYVEKREKKDRLVFVFNIISSASALPNYSKYYY